MPGPSLTAAYFDGIFASDDDPWNLARSGYEAAKFARTRAVLADRRYARGLEIGCAHGVLTGRIADLCDSLLAVDISARAIEKARARLGRRAGIALRRMAFPREAPAGEAFDLVLLSEVAYFWDDSDLDRAATWLCDHVGDGGRVMLVHYIGETDYPQTGDSAVGRLWEGLADGFARQAEERHARYRLDLWQRR